MQLPLGLNQSPTSGANHLVYNASDSPRCFQVMLIVNANSRGFPSTQSKLVSGVMSWMGAPSFYTIYI